jgi:hypothetical protein
MLNRQDDGLGAFRGLFWGILLSLPIWAVIFSIIF